MLLALDVGNTNITIGVFKRKEIIEVFRITTKLPRTSDEFGILISNLLKEKGLDEGEVKAAIGCSIVISPITRGFNLLLLINDL